MKKAWCVLVACLLSFTIVASSVHAQGGEGAEERDPTLEQEIHTRLAEISPAAGNISADELARQLQDVVAAARRAAGNDDVVLSPGSGGSLPLYLFTDVLEKPILMVPIANHDDLQHAPDENLRIWNLWYGIDMYAAILTMR